MTEISQILALKEHRPFPYPNSPWAFYQEWKEVIFMHWPVPPEIMQKLLPDNLTVDTYGGQAYISLVAFKAKNSRPRLAPPVSLISDFLELNIRTYVKRADRPGIYFLNMEADKTLSSFIFRNLTGFPYYPANMQYITGQLSSVDENKHNYCDLEFELPSHSYSRSELDSWLTERYCVYLNRINKLWRYDVHHVEWPLQNLKIKELNLKYQFGDFVLKDPKPPLMHYSIGVEVLGWLPKIIST